jgi:hypothetical protein
MFYQKPPAKTSINDAEKKQQNHLQVRRIHPVNQGAWIAVN